MNLSKYRIPSVVGVLVLVLGLAAGVMLLGQEQIFRLGASADSEPRDVRISNVTDETLTVSWTTGRKVVGYLSWGQSPSLGRIERQIDSSSKNVHSVTLSGLSPNTNYYFVINSAGADHDNSGVPWSVQTGPTLAGPTGTALASGVLLSQNGSPASGAVVYINGGSIAQLSTITSPSGSWTIPLSTARTKTLTSYSALNADSNLEIVAKGADGVSTAQVLVSNTNPVPNMTLGQSHDFRTNTTNQTGGLPGASVNLPQNTNVQPTGPGGLDTSGSLITTDTETVTLDSIDEPNEVIFTTTPEFFGEGPPNTVITITVESDPISGTVSVGTNGSWNWSPPQNLEEGSHKITISWTDASGFLRSLTRTFIVQAAEGEPSFESTPSGSTPTPTSSPSPSPSPTPTATPTSTPSPSPSPTSTISSTPSPTRASIPSTESGVPEAGSLTPTLFLSSIGLLLLFSGIFISRRNIQ